MKVSPHSTLKKFGIRYLVILILLPILIITLSACGSDDDEGEQGSSSDTNQEPIVIGVSLPLSGRFSEPGNAAKNGYDVWVEMVNDQGGLLGRQVQLRVLDNESDPDTAVADYERLISEDNVDLVVGTFSSLLVIPTSEVVASHGYAYIEPAGGAPEVFDRGLENVFFAQPAISAGQADPISLYILGLPPDQRPQTYAVVSLDDPFTLSVAERVKALLSDAELDLVYDQVYPENTTDFSEIASEVAELDPDLIIGATQQQDSIDQILAYQAAGYQPRIAFFTNGPSIPTAFKEALGPATEGIFSAISWYPDADSFQNNEFVTAYVEMFGGSIGDIPEDAANAFTVGQVLQQAVSSTESIDNATLITELHRGTYETIVGSLSFDRTGKPQGSVMLLQWQGDSFFIVGPTGRPEVEVDPVPPPKPEW